MYLLSKKPALLLFFFQTNSENYILEEDFEKKPWFLHFPCRFIEFVALERTRCLFEDGVCPLKLHMIVAPSVAESMIPQPVGRRVKGLQSHSPETLPCDPAASTATLFIAKHPGLEISDPFVFVFPLLSLARAQKDHVLSCLARVRSRSSDPFGGGLPSLGDSW